MDNHISHYLSIFPTVLWADLLFTCSPKFAMSTLPVDPLSQPAPALQKTYDFLDSVFQPTVSTLHSDIKDTTHALNIFSSITLDPQKTYHLFLLDVCSLYTSIPHAWGDQSTHILSGSETELFHQH
jgi:hypothetical protein